MMTLPRSVARTATVTARTGAMVYELGREPFLMAVLGHAATRREADSIADTVLAADAARSRLIRPPDLALGQPAGPAVRAADAGEKP
jgi:CRP-like cAMP-binding protein